MMDARMVEQIRERARQIVGDNPPPLTPEQQQTIRSAFGLPPVDETRKDAVA